MSTSSESTNQNTCVVCYKNVKIFSIGMCEHPVCYECSTRMRVLCRQNECPICRQDLPKVVFTKEIKPFRQLKKGNLLDTRYDIYFDSPEIQGKFYELLVDTCTVCREKQVFSNFNSLKEHMRRAHELHYCDLCVDNLKIFSHERRCYTRSDLALHRRKGDVDDKSHKGHPLCEFCDQRYMDNDELYRHLRRDHLYCHFCDADGLHQYYSSYDYLREHFRLEHYLCEEGPCAEEKFTSVFRTDIDLKAHKASIHGKQMGKAAAKQARTLELEFTLAPRGDSRSNRRGMTGPSTSRNSRDYNNSNREYPQASNSNISNQSSLESEATFIKQPSVDVQSTEEFPTLGNSTPFVPSPAQSKGRNNVTIRSTLRPQPLAVTDENFPALGPESSGISKTVNFSVSSNKSTSTTSNSTSNVSIRVNHEPNGTVTTRVSGPNIRIRPAQLSIDSEFPALGSTEPSTSATNNTHWKEVLQWTCTKSAAPVSKSKKPAPCPLAPSPPTIQSGDDFPCLSKSSKSKKQSSITVGPATWVQPQTSTTKTTTDSRKGKTKKKKAKQLASNSSSSNDSANSKTTGNNAKNDIKTPKEAAITIRDEDSPTNKSLGKDSKTDQRKNKNIESSCSTVVNAEGSSNVQRKRTELKIDSLNSTNNNFYDDFPALCGISKPPGFLSPPPGFETTTLPPPGFSIKCNGVQQITNSNGLTFTNSSGESYSILPDNSNTASSCPHLPDFHKRNQRLSARISEVLTQKAQADKFREVSTAFRKGSCSAEEFYKHCKEVMDLGSFETIFPELLVLLPDIAQQQELFRVHKKGMANKVKDLEACATCGQILKAGNELRTHLSSHSLENHFPALGKPNSSIKNSWPRK
ncbi:E3 ubiquitin-protein ligase ZNF598 [Prorops nasuta]|uniref:E3 ubiquitin-protein ligase ZNF598 n=1 Tax=Prorops nasuta TaxID=863751 RepID=UPI0034CFA352